MNRDECWDSVDVSTNSDADVEAKTDADQFICESFTDKLYVPKRSYRKYVKPWHLALAGVVLFSIIVIIIVATSTGGGSVVDDNKNAAKYASSGLLICEDNVLWNYDFKEKRARVVQNMGKVVGSFDLHKDVAFWSEPNGSKILMSGNNVNKNEDVLFEELRFKVQAMAVDFFTNKLYAIDQISGTAIVIDLQSKRFGILLTDLKQPQDILLDPSKGLMFILQPLDSILRSNMDGTGLYEVIRSAIYITAITLDYSNKMIYGIYNYNTILRTDYHGLNREVILKEFVNIASLAVSNDHLFWLLPSSESHNSTLWSCQIKKYTCQNHQVQPIGLRNATTIKPLSHKTAAIDTSNPCTRHRNICQHLCLLSSEINAGRSCGCYVGWESKSDPRSCQAVREFLVYVIGSVVRSRTLNFDRESFTEAFLPLVLSTKSLTVKGSVDLDYDARNDTLYVSDDVHVYRMNLRRPSEQEILLTAPSSHFIEDLAFDWLSQNLYYSNCSKSSEHFHSIHALNVRETHRLSRTLQNFTYRDGFGLKGCPYATVCDPLEGNVFFSAEENSYRSIYRTTLNGTRLRMQSKNIDYVHQFRLLALDSAEKRLYWIHRSGLEARIRHVYYDGSDENYVHVGAVINARNIYVHGQWMYLSNDFSIWRGNKSSGRDFHRVVPRTDSDLTESVSAMKVVNLTLEADTTSDNPCSNSNGGCEQFCYSSPRQTCGCVDDHKLQDGGRCS